MYSTSGCHLCEQALQVIAWTLQGQPWQLEEIDIVESDALIQRYGVRIPVIRLRCGGERAASDHGDEWEIGWPFEPEDLKALIARSSK